MYPEYPPRVRLEWLLATARIVLAGGALLAVVLGPFPETTRDLLEIILAGYVLYSLMVLALVWTPVRFAAGWDLAVHLFDLAAFSVLLFLTIGESSAFYAYFIFLIICGTLRWHSWGACWTAVAAIGAYAVTSWYGVSVLHQPAFAWTTFFIRSVHLVIVAVLVGYMGVYHRRFQQEIGRLASWPRKIPPDAHALVGEILAESAEILGAPRIVLVWDEPTEGYLNIASRSDGDMTWTHEPEATFGSVVMPGLESKNFQTSDAGDEHAVVVYSSAGSFRQRRCRPVNSALQRRHQMRGVQSWSLDGELIRGRIFCLDKRHMRLDDLLFGVLVARLAVSRLDSLYLLKHLRESAALEERLRLARDLHDGLVQSVAGSALQLLAARRLLDRDPPMAAKRFGEVQDQLERGELEMRSFISRLRPSTSAPALGIGLEQRLEDLRGRVERQWAIKVKIQLHVAADEWPHTLANSVYRMIQEGVLNAARHADASVIRVEISVADGVLRVDIVDDGRGFPFRGTYDLNALNEMNRGPLTLKERVGELHGDLELRSKDTGTELLIRLPFAKVAG